MELKKNFHIPNPQIQEPKTNPLPAPIQVLDDSETYESSQKCKTDYSEKKSSIDYLTKNLKKSLGFFSKKNLYMENIDSNLTNNIKRKYSLEEKLVIKKDFVPQLRPIEIHLVPSKLRLNKKGFKDLKCNKDNKILLMSNNYFISAPNSEEEEEEESEIDFSPQIKHKNEDIKSTRKNLQKMKSGSLPKVLSRKSLEHNCKMYKEEMKIDYESDNDSIDFKKSDNYLNDDNLLLYDDNDFINYKININGEDKKEKEGEHNTVRTNRINSCSILDVLRNRFSFDDVI
jgi:hypothetical protein